MTAPHPRPTPLRLRLRRQPGATGAAYALTGPAGEEGRYVAHAVAPDELEAGTLRLRLTTAGLLAPVRLALAPDGSRRATLRHAPLTGRATVTMRARGAVPLERHGLLRPRWVLRDAQTFPTLRVTAAPGGHAAEVDAELAPSAEWPREDLLTVLALLVHARLRRHAVVAGSHGKPPAGR